MKLWRKFKRAMLRIEIAEYESDLSKIIKHPAPDGLEAMLVAAQLKEARKALKAELQYEIDLETRAKIRRIRL